MKPKVEIYTWSTCPYSQKAKKLLAQRNIEFIEHCIDGDDDARNDMSIRASGSSTLPQVFINNRHIGGCGDLHIIDEIGTLEEILRFGEPNKQVAIAPEAELQQLAIVEIYTWSTCPYSQKAKALLQEKNVKYIEYCIDGNDVARKAMTNRANGRNTLPQIFINSRAIGGCDDLHILNDIGSLEELLYSDEKSHQNTAILSKC